MYFRFVNSTCIYELRCAVEFNLLIELHGIYKLYIYIYVLPHNQGQSGCKNINDGGESVATNEEGPFFVYFVHKSFKRPSMQSGIFIR